MPASTVFELATMGGARALHKEDEIGSIEIGKKADLVFWNFNQVWNSLLNYDLSSILSTIVYSSTAENINSVMIDGEFVYKSKENLLYDEKEIIETAAKELKSNLDRAGL
jgi:5-methylthioadenosine/S-adenosylhomocysteine deaminase